VFGAGETTATIILKDRRATAAFASMDMLAICEAYIYGSIDVEGDFERVAAFGSSFRDDHPLSRLMRWVRPLMRGQVAEDRANIPEHYDLDPDFFRLWLDRRHRCYSQGVFTRPDESLEDAIGNKLDYALAAVNARPGDHILDIGGGWGAFIEHAGKRGIRVTSLTISDVSHAFISDIIARTRIDCSVRLEHFYDHRPAHRYDGIVNMGVTEHLPDYARSMRQYDALLKPGGKVYLDASASRRHGGVSAFQEKYVFRGNGMLLCLHEYLAACAASPFEPEIVINDRVNYERTARHWAQNLDRHRAEIEARWGQPTYRIFQIYLWNTAYSFRIGRTQAYRLVLARP
jgi:cyclopropane-fatty-acyl-phospholipid synthase